MVDKKNANPDEDEEIGCCTECHSVQNTQKLIRNPFFQQGGAIPCQFCGGIVVITRRDRLKQTLKQADRERGL